jgi:hypothetical protein
MKQRGGRRLEPGWLTFRTLRRGDRESGYTQRTPAMTASLTDHVWSLEE